LTLYFDQIDIGLGVFAVESTLDISLYTNKPVHTNTCVSSAPL